MIENFQFEFVRTNSLLQSDIYNNNQESRRLENRINAKIREVKNLNSQLNDKNRVWLESIEYKPITR